MKLVFYNDFIPGVVSGDNIVDISEIVNGIPHVGPGDLMSRLIETFDRYKDLIESAEIDHFGTGVPITSVRLRAPVPKPGKILCMAGNYLENGTLKEPTDKVKITKIKLPPKIHQFTFVFSFPLSSLNSKP